MWAVARNLRRRLPRPRRQRNSLRPRRSENGRNRRGRVRPWRRRQEQLTTTHLKRLEHVRGLLQAKAEPGAEGARLFLCSATVFSAGLIERAAHDPSVQLIGLERLYYDSSS